MLRTLVSGPELSVFQDSLPVVEPYERKGERVRPPLPTELSTGVSQGQQELLLVQQPQLRPPVSPRSVRHGVLLAEKEDRELPVIIDQRVERVR